MKKATPESAAKRRRARASSAKCGVDKIQGILLPFVEARDMSFCLGLYQEEEGRNNGGVSPQDLVEWADPLEGMLELAPNAMLAWVSIKRAVVQLLGKHPRLDPWLKEKTARWSTRRSP